MSTPIRAPEPRVGPESRFCTKTANVPDGFLKGEPGVALAPTTPGGWLEGAPGYAHGRHPAGAAVQPAGDQHGLKKRDPQCRNDRRRRSLPVDSLEDGVEPQKLAGGVQRQQLIRKRVIRWRNGKALAERVPDCAARLGSNRQIQIALLRIRVAQVSAADLIVAGGTAIFPFCGPGRATGGLPDQAFERDRAPATWTGAGK